MRRSISPELRLILAASRWPADKDDLEYVKRCANSEINWPHFLAGLRRHRVTPLVFHNLTAASLAIPDFVWTRLRRRMHRIAQRNLRQAAAQVALTEELSRAGIPVVSLKGAALAIILFGDPMMRESNDVDLLVDAEAVDEAERILIGSGYRRIEPSRVMDDVEQALYRRYFYHYKFFNEEKRVIVELHWRLFSDPNILSSEVSKNNNESAISLLNKTIFTLKKTETFLYLCVHGASHAWFRAKWLTEVAALLRQQSPEAYQEVVSEAKRRGLFPAVEQAVSLSRIYLGGQDPPGSRDMRLSLRSRLTLPIARWAMGSSDFTERRALGPSVDFATVIHNQCLLGGWRSWRRALTRVWIYPHNWKGLNAPKILYPFYALYRAIGWMVAKFSAETGMTTIDRERK